MGRRTRTPAMSSPMRRSQAPTCEMCTDPATDKRQGFEGARESRPDARGTTNTRRMAAVHMIPAPPSVTQHRTYASNPEQTLRRKDETMDDRQDTQQNAQNTQNDERGINPYHTAESRGVNDDEIWTDEPAYSASSGDESG